MCPTGQGVQVGKGKVQGWGRLKEADHCYSGGGYVNEAQSPQEANVVLRVILPQSGSMYSVYIACKPMTSQNYLHGMGPQSRVKLHGTTDTSAVSQSMVQGEHQVMLSGRRIPDVEMSDNQPYYYSMTDT